MVVARFCSEGQYYKTVYGLAQWDYGQILQVYGLNLPDGIEVHLAEEFGELSFPVSGHKEEDGSITVVIPDVLLQSGKPVLAHIYAYDDVSGETLRTILMPVKKQAKPENYGDSGLTPVEELLSGLNAKADNLSLQDGFLQLMSGEKTVGDRIRLNVGSEREIEMRNTGSAIEWRYTDSNEWRSLISLDDIRGPAGETPEFEIREGHLYAIYRK